MNTIYEQKIILAFDKRIKPTSCFEQSIKHDYSDKEIERFLSFSRYDIPVEVWEEYYDIIFFLKPNAFCYYLPSILIRTLDFAPHSMILHALFSPLDCSPTPQYWSSHCYNFLYLSSNEISVLIEYFLYVFEKMEFVYKNEGDRIYDTLCIMEEFINGKRKLDDYSINISPLALRV